DASVIYGGASAATFQEMLVFAQTEHPGARVIIKSHPETAAGQRAGYFGEKDQSARVSLLRDPVSPWALLEGACAVYTVSSQMGFEAIHAGLKPRVFGQPFYAGWGLSDDENPVARRERKLTRAQIFAAAMILYPKWYDQFADRLCTLEHAISLLEAEVRAWREDRTGYVACGMRLWKRANLQRFYGSVHKLRFEDRPERAAALARARGRDVLVWAGKETGDLSANTGARAVLRVEDGFLRSRGLGAALVPALSLVRDDLGIYYDPGRESRLETLIAARVELPEDAATRVEQLIARLNRARLSKYNLGQARLPDLPAGRRILVPGQVEDDASIRLGCDAVRSNLELLRAVRSANPDAVILYKPHPDVEAGLRKGEVAEKDLRALADLVLSRADPVALIEAVGEVWTMTSLLGFEALLRDTPVTCLGQPFYAGWGLTTDLGGAPSRRRARPSLAGLAHATLIDYPRYLDPVMRRPCPVETIVARLQSGGLPRLGPFSRALSKLQGVFASHADWWR
ncbi:MAG: capsular polysaccharide biosynthesis protein, partial [Halocynthiibacter sp.]